MTGNWKPIETAPKDGTEVLLYWPLEGLGDLHSKIKIGSWHNDAWGWQDRFCRSYTDAPTHWQPLPGPPKPRKPRDPVDAEYSARRLKPKPRKRDLQSETLTEREEKTLPYDTVL